MTRCPQCGEPAEPGQLVCVNCGHRLALRERPRYLGPPRSALPAVILLLAVVVIGAGALGFALGDASSDNGGSGQVKAETGQAPSAVGGKPQTTTQSQTTTTPASTTTPQHGLLLQWPRGVTGYTVVLVTTGDRAAARRVAIEAARSGVEAGLLRSDDYDLGTGLWIVFAGRFDTRAGATKQAADLGKRYPGAYAQLVKPVR